LIIPARDEAESIHRVIAEVREHFDGTIIVVDNGSTDSTAEWARAAGAQTAWEPRAGYGRACQAGISAAPTESEVFVFMDADGSDRPEDISALLAAIDSGADLALGIRNGEGVEKGSIAPAARFGNLLSGFLIGAIWGEHPHDLSPLKAIRAEALHALDLRQQTYGWTVEMLAKAARAELTIAEVEVGYRHRAGGASKVSGNFGASLKAGYRILLTIAQVAFSGFTRPSSFVLAGGALGLVLLIAFGTWLWRQAPASSGVLVAVLLLAWPFLLLTVGMGIAASAFARGRRQLPHSP
ncbi:MAG: glycosyltransferase family 2 protein, partial [Tepidiformaceae bacterium]